MADDVGLREVLEADSVYPAKDALDLDEPRLLARREIDLRLVASDHGLGVNTEAGEEHLHLRAGGVLRLVQDHECVGQRAAAHVGERRNLDGTSFERLLHPLGRHHVVECVVERTQIGIHLRLQVTGEKAETLTSLHRRSGEDDPAHALARECLHGHGYGQIRLPRSGWSDPDDDVVIRDALHVCCLTGRFRLDYLARAGQNDSLLAGGPGAVPVTVAVGRSGLIAHA
jgi:hypothetical protein